MQREPFSIVVPVYNRATLIVRTLESIYAQTYRPLRLIVVDNASTDSTASVVEKWGAEKSDDDFSLTLVNDPVAGAAHARNTGLARVNTPWMCFFDSDDCMRPGLVEEVMKTVAAEPTLEIIGWPMVYHGLNGRQRLFPNRRGNDLLNHIIHCTFCTDRFAVRTDFIRSSGCWNSRLKGWDDWELGIRMLLRSPRIKFLSSPLVDYYATEDSLTGLDYSGRAGVWEEALRYATEAISRSRRSDKGRLLRFMRFRECALAGFYGRENRKDLALPLIEEVKHDRSLSPLHRRILKLAYRMHSRGMRGSWYAAYYFL